MGIVCWVLAIVHVFLRSYLTCFFKYDYNGFHHTLAACDKSNASGLDGAYLAYAGWSFYAYSNRAPWGSIFPIDPWRWGSIRAGSRKIRFSVLVCKKLIFNVAPPVFSHSESATKAGIAGIFRQSEPVRTVRDVGFLQCNGAVPRLLQGVFFDCPS